jgi:hypothetical protein
VDIVCNSAEGLRTCKLGNCCCDIEPFSKPNASGVYAYQSLSLGAVGKARVGKAKVANRTREIRLSGMKTEAWRNVTDGGIVNPSVVTERDRMETLNLKVRALQIYPNDPGHSSKLRCSGAPVTRLRPEREIGCSRIGDNKSIRQVGRKQGRPELRPMMVRESEGLIRAEKLGNGWYPEPAEQRRPVLV